MIAGALGNWLMSRGEAAATDRDCSAMRRHVYADDQLRIDRPGQATSQVTLFLVDPPEWQCRSAVVADRARHRTNLDRRQPGRCQGLSSRCRLAPATLHASGVRVATSFSARLFNLITNVPPEPVADVHCGYQVAGDSSPPLLHNQALAISVTSHNGMLYFGISADCDAMSVDLVAGAGAKH